MSRLPVVAGFLLLLEGVQQGKEYIISVLGSGSSANKQKRANGWISSHPANLSGVPELALITSWWSFSGRHMHTNTRTDAC